MNPIPVEKADGIFFWDYNGKKYYDMSSQLANVNLGYGNKEIINAIKEQVDILPYIAPAYASGPRAELAKMIIDLAPDNMGKVFFSCGGSDANEAAIYAARTFTGKSKVLSRYRSYHGSTLGSGNLSGDPEDLRLKDLPQTVILNSMTHMFTAQSFSSRTMQRLQSITSTSLRSRFSTRIQIRLPQL